MNTWYSSRCLLALVLALAIQAVPALVKAADDPTAALRREVEALELTVRQLAQRVSELEKRTAAPAAAPHEPANLDDGRLSLHERWQSIHRQMNAEQVKDILGEPQQQFAVADKTVWYYHYPNNRRGSVTFFQDMRVAGWQAPPAGGF